jgi:hypothetical protein
MTLGNTLRLLTVMGLFHVLVLLVANDSQLHIFLVGCNNLATNGALTVSREATWQRH